MLRKNPPAAILLALAFVPTLSGFASSGENLQLSSAANGLRCFEAAPARDRHALSRCSPEHTRAEGVESGARSRGDSVPGRWANHCREAGSDRAEGQGLAGARDAMLYLRGGGQEEEDETQKLNRPAHAAFKGFDPHTEIRTCAKMRSSEMRHVKNDLVASYPMLAPILEAAVKGGTLRLAKCSGQTSSFLSLVLDGKLPLMFQSRGGPFFPLLRLLHRFPDMLPHFRVDAGALRHVISGAVVMAQGLCNTGGQMADVVAGTAVALMVENKEHAVGIAVALRSTEAIRKDPTGPAVEVLHVLKDGLWPLIETAG